MSVIKIKGNIESLRKSILDEIEALYDLEIHKDELVPKELALRIAELTGRINREIAVYINRKGSILDISIGDSHTVSLPEFEGRRNVFKLSGVRCIHTHPNGDGMPSSVDIRSLLTLRLDAMIAIGVKDGKAADIYAALAQRDVSDAADKAAIYGPFSSEDKRMNYLFEIIADIDKADTSRIHNNENEEEKAILVGLETSPGRIINNKSSGERLLDELEELSQTAGVKVLKKVLQKKSSQDPGYYIGKGMAEQLSLLRQSLNANVIIFDDELTGAQVKNLENIIGAKVIDRTTLILDIFAQRARSKEGKIQVELAQLKYRLPRLLGMGSELSRLGGGIGTRGPGEKKLEVDRRHIRKRLSILEAELKELGRRRDLLREGRNRNSIPTAALVGYTNAGKSTLMNRLSGSDVFAENKLFATLDPTVRSAVLPDGREILLIDTVGFIRKLPHELIKAFKSTLEEAVFADILLHVVDISSPEAEEQISVVSSILHDLGAAGKPVLLALNKTDLLENSERTIIADTYNASIEISAATGKGVDELLGAVLQALPLNEVELNLLIPYNEGWVLPYIHQNGTSVKEEYSEEGIKIRAVVKKAKAERLQKFVT